MTYFTAALAALLTFVILHYVYAVSLGVSFAAEVGAYAITAIAGLWLKR